MPTRNISAYGVMLLTAIVSACNDTPRKSAAPTAAPIAVSVTQLSPAPVTVYEHYSAQAEAPYTLELRAQASGRLERQAVEDGAQVVEGQVLYVIDARDASAARNQARAQLAQALASLTQALQTVDRYRTLVQQGFVSAQAFDNAQTQAAAARANVQAQRAALSETDLSVGYATIRAPRAGRVSISQVRPGELVTAQQTLLNTLYSDDPMWISFTVSQRQSEAFQTTRATDVGSQSDEASRYQIIMPNGRPYAQPGALSFVDSALDSRTGTLRIRLSVENRQHQLRPGMFVRVAVPVFHASEALRVPQQAVMELQGIKTVYVVQGSDQVLPRRITATHRIEQDWVVQDGLQPGDRVVVEGIQKLQMRPDARIQAMPWAPAAPPARDNNVNTAAASG